MVCGLGFAKNYRMEKLCFGRSVALHHYRNLDIHGRIEGLDDGGDLGGGFGLHELGA